MISLIPNPDQISDENIVNIILTIDDEVNKKAYEGIYINLIIKKVGTLNQVPSYRLRYNGEPLIFEINKYTYGGPGTFQVTANIYDGPSFASTTFIVTEKFKMNNVNIGAGVTSKVQLQTQANSNSRNTYFPKYEEPNPNAQKVQQTGVDYFKTTKIEPINQNTIQEPILNTNKVQGKGRNVGPGY
jgi:hypothetical protein